MHQNNQTVIRGSFMNEQVQYKDILATLKSLAKTKGIKYAQISEDTGIAESSLRKIFTGRDCPLTSILKICSALEVTLDEVLSLQKNKKMKFYEFNDEQDRYFADFYDCYKLYIRVLRKHEKIGDVVKDLGISEAVHRQYLKDLESLKLIERMPEDRIKFLHPEAIIIRPNSRIYHKVTRETADSLLDELPKKKVRPNEKLYEIGSMRSSEQLFRNFIEDVNKCFEDFRKKVNKEVKHLADEELIPVTYILAVGEHDTIGK